MLRSQNKPSHIQQVDYVRAIASVGVALFHLGGKVLPVLKYGWLGVQMFFVLSGFIICHSLPDNYSIKHALQFIFKRMVRIEPPYIISIALILLLHFVFLNSYRPDWTNVVMHLAYLNSVFGKEYLSPVYWTLGIEFQFYILIAFAYPLLKTKWGVWLFMALCVVCYLNIPYIALAGVFPFFFVGILFHLYKKRKISVWLSCIFLVASAAISFLKLGFEATAAALFAVTLLLSPLRGNKVISFLSAISFSLYLTHDMIGASMVVYLGTLFPKTLAFKGLSFITGIIISIAFAWLFYKLVEMPFLRLSKKVGYKSRDKKVADASL